MSDSEEEIAGTVAETSDTSDMEQQYEHDIEEEDDDNDNDNDDDEEEEEDDDDDEPEEVAVAVVDEEDDEDELPDAAVQAELVPVEDVEDAPMEDDDDDDDDPPILPPSSTKSLSKKTASKPTSSVKRLKSNSKKTSKVKAPHGISGDRLMAAEAARDMLHTAVPRLPVPLSENYIVRNFGQLNVTQNGADAYSTPTSLYPVGFSCDRFEFSPVHGRLLKLRCTIIDGKRTNRDFAGPIFRVMWGQGVDEAMDKVDYPYNPYANSAPISSGKNDVLAVPASSDKSHPRRGTPSEGMRVKVRFEKEMFYFGTIEKVDTPKEDGKKKRKRHHDIHIRYDDGSLEMVEFPDPDVTLVMPGVGDETDADGNPQVSYLNGKPVISTIGDTPLEAWSKCLVKLGMVDEIILERAMEALRVSKEAPQRDEDKPEPLKAQSNADAFSARELTGEEKRAVLDTESPTGSAEGLPKEQDDREPVSDDEQVMRDSVAALRLQMQELKAEDEAATADLADSRIQMLGRFLINPFRVGETDKVHQASWMAAAVRKEKTKMGSTGNKRKVVTATDLLERNDTFFNPEVEALLEGLPGSEYCTIYDYQANRGAVTASSKWLQEQKAVYEREVKRRTKASNEAKVKASLEKEKEIKRKRRDDERDARKRQKLDEEDEKKKLRIQDRLKKLKIHIDDKLFKEASFQREKVVLLLAKNLSREFARRRKAAEQLSRETLDTQKVPELRIEELPALASQYDEDIVRIWDFISTFGSFFVQSGYMQKLPTLDDLQFAIDTLRGNKTKMNKAEATTFVTELAVALCKPLSAGITRLLFASLIALNPVLQKDFGAAFFNEINSTKIKDGEERLAHEDILLPVDTFTWKEIARIAFQADALGEIGYARQDAAHVLRGYRSAGHPNSKEARRIRRVEDHPVALLRQILTEGHLPLSQEVRPHNAVRVEIPSSQSCTRNEWSFYLHNINSMTEPLDAQLLEANLKKSLELANIADSGASMDSRNELERLADSISHSTKGPELSMVQTSVRKILEEASGEIYSGRYEEIIVKEANSFADKADLVALQKVIDSNLYRARMGELDSLKLDSSELRRLTHLREVYMADALRLKEEMKRPDDEDDDDEEDDDDDLKTDNKKSEDASKSLNTELLGEGTGEEQDIASFTGETAIVAEGSLSDVVEAAEQSPSKALRGDGKIGKNTPYDEFCADIPTAPELLRRCLAVTRALCLSGPSEPFIYPVDPQSNPGYYDMLLQPMCMREVGMQLQKATKEYAIAPEEKKEALLEKKVTDFARNVRLIGRNCLCYINAGPMIIAAGGEMLRIFERLLLDWVLAPREYLAPLECLDDDLCVDSHPSDLESTVLLCDSCEGNFNVSRLTPPLVVIPKGDWYCPRCLSRRWWGDLDPRIGKTVKLKEFDGAAGVVRRCLFAHAETMGSPSFMYEVDLDSGTKELATLADIDDALNEAGVHVPKISCLEAVTESQGYGNGIDHGLRHDLVPVVLHPKVADAASQVAPSSSVFRDLIAAASTLLINDSQEMKADEWLRLLALLIMKCSSSDIMQNFASEMEEKAAERLAIRMDNISKMSCDITDILPIADQDMSDTSEESLPVEVEANPMDDHEEGPEYGIATPIRSTATAMDEIVARTVEVSAVPIDERESEGVLSHVQADPPEEAGFRNRRTAALAEKAKRQKAREDSFAAFCIKNQVRSTIASFEQDNVSQVIEATLNTTEYGLSFAASRCRHTPCSFCSLSDTSLGIHLIRAPDANEWNERIIFGARSRRTNMIAEVQDASLRFEKGKKLMAVSVRVGDDLVADERSDLEFDQTPDGGMLEFVPRNPDAFQDDLRFRYQHGLPFVTGSLSSHETCAISVHNARKVKVVQDFKDRQASLAELEEGNTCGRSLEICRDKGDRAYWSFHSEPESLFVSFADGKWYKYADPETIASVIVCLGRDPTAKELMRVFPKANNLLKTGLWTDLLLKRRFKVKARNEEADDISSSMELDHDAEKADIYDVQDEVLVESKDSARLWDAEIKAIAKNSEGKVTGYRVHYLGWGSRFDEWVSEDRVVEANDHNRQVQADMRKDAATLHGGLPASLENMQACSYLFAKDRARGATPLPDFERIANVPPNAAEDLRIFAAMKAAVLAIEAALPLGSVNHLDSGAWSAKFAGQWRLMVQNAEGSWNLMRCVILLEDVIGEEWIKEQIGHLRLCLPSRWKALDEASPSSLALRIFLLDRAIMYGTVDRRRYRSRSKK